MTRGMQPVDQLVLGVRLAEVDFQPERLARRTAALLDIGQRFRAVDMPRVPNKFRFGPFSTSTLCLLIVFLLLKQGQTTIGAAPKTSECGASVRPCMRAVFSGFR